MFGVCEPRLGARACCSPCLSGLGHAAHCLPSALSLKQGIMSREAVELPGVSPGLGRDAAVSPRPTRGQNILAAEDEKSASSSSTTCLGFPKKYKGRPVTCRSCIYLTFDDPGFCCLAKVIAIMMMLLILTVTTTYVLESEATLESGVLAKTDALSIFQDGRFDRFFANACVLSNIVKLWHAFPLQR